MRLKNFFTYNNENISGISFSGGVIIGYLLFILIVGIYILAINCFKRSMSIFNNKKISYLITSIYSYFAVSPLIFQGDSNLLEYQILIYVLINLFLTLYPAKYTNKG